jgi:septal ring factor EnvC (AmiA/AmiB activator)
MGVLCVPYGDGADMTITTEEAELLARISDFNGPTRRGAIIRSLAAERDALKAEKVNLQDDLASVERERAHQQGRADRNAAEYAREQKKREQLQAENARLRKLVAYLAGTNTDHVQVALAGNPIVCDAIHAEALAALGETQ